VLCCSGDDRGVHRPRGSQGHHSEFKGSFPLSAPAALGSHSRAFAGHGSSHVGVGCVEVHLIVELLFCVALWSLGSRPDKRQALYDCHDNQSTAAVLRAGTLGRDARVSPAFVARSCCLGRSLGRRAAATAHIAAWLVRPWLPGCAWLWLWLLRCGAWWSEATTARRAGGRVAAPGRVERFCGVFFCSQVRKQSPRERQQIRSSQW
jgi:hypothetical protein